MSLTLCDTAAQLPTSEIWEERMTNARGKGMGALADAFINRCLTKSGQKRLPDQVQKIRKMISETPVEGFCGCCCAIRDMDQRESIRAISTPALVMVGEHDPGTPVSAAEFIPAQIKTSEMKIVYDAAHFINVEQAAVFDEALVQFLSTNNGAS